MHVGDAGEMGTGVGFCEAVVWDGEGEVDGGGGRGTY